MKKTIFILLSLLIIGASFTGKYPDCRKLSLKEQGQVINEFLTDYRQWQSFKSSLRQNGYCLSQFGLKEHNDLPPDSQEYEISEFTESMEDAALRCENLMNEFEPGSEKYETFSRCLDKLNQVLKEFENKH